MVKKILLILTVLLILPGVLATDTTINVKTHINHNVTINVLKTSNLELIESFNADSGPTGLATVVFSSNTESKIGLSVLIRYNGKLVEYASSDDLGEFYTDQPISVDVPLIEPEPEPECTADTDCSEGFVCENEACITAPEPEIVEAGGEEISAEDEPTSEEASITGEVISDSNLSWVNSSTTYFISGGVVLVLIVGAILFFFLKRGGSPQKFKVTPLSKFQSRDERKIEMIENKQLEEAERKIREAQAELSRIKNKKSALTEAQEKFERAKQELERLKGE